MQNHRFNHPPEVTTLEGLGGSINFTSGDGSVTFTKNGNNIDFSATGGGGGTAYYTWSAPTGTTAMVTGKGYVANDASALPFTLPTTAAVGDHFKIVGLGAGGWTVAQNSGQVIHFGNVNTTSGVGGSLASQNRYDCVELICVVANTGFAVVDAQGNITVN